MNETLARRAFVSLVMVALLASLLLVASPRASAYGGAVTLQSTASGQSLSCSPGSCTFGTVTVGGSDTLVTSYAALAGQTGSVSIFLTSPICGSTSLTTLANFTISGTSAFSRIYLFYGVGFASGALSCGATVVGGTGSIFIFATQAWSNVLQSAPIGQNAQATGTTQTNYTASVTNTPGSNDLMVDWNLAMAGTVNVPSPGASQTSQWTKTIAAAIYGRGSTKSPTAVIPKTMYDTVSVANAAWGQYVVDIASDFIAPVSSPTKSGSSYSWSSGGQWSGGTLSNVVVSGNCIALAPGATSGTWTSANVNTSGVLAGINLTYSGASAARYVSNVAILDSNAAVVWQLSSQLYLYGGSNLSTSSTSVTTWALRLTLVGDGSGSMSVCAAGVKLNPLTLTPKPFDWLPYLIVGLILVAVVVTFLVWRYVA